VYTVYVIGTGCSLFNMIVAIRKHNESASLGWFTAACFSLTLILARTG